MTLWISVTVLFILLITSAFFSAAETAYSSIDKFTLQTKLKKNLLANKLIKKHYRSFGWTISTILFGNNIVNIGMSSIATILFNVYFSDEKTLVLTIAVVSPVVIIFGEIIPKLLAKRYPFGYLKKIVYIMEFLRILLLPLTFLFVKPVSFYKTNITEGEVKDIANVAAKQRSIKHDEAAYISRSLELNSTKVKQIMIPKKSFIYVNFKSATSHVLNIFKKSGHSRLPVLKNGKFIGIIMLKDIMKKNFNELWTEKIMEIPRFSIETSVTTVLEKMRVEKIHISFIETNKTKNIVGLVTLEDIFEEIFGEIYDEHDPEININQIGPNKWIVDGNTLMKDIKLLVPNVKFEQMKNLTVKQWMQKHIKNKIRKNYVYNYKKVLTLKVVGNTQKETKIEIKKNFK